MNKVKTCNQCEKCAIGRMVVRGPTGWLCMRPASLDSGAMVLLLQTSLLKRSSVPDDPNPPRSKIAACHAQEVNRTPVTYSQG